MKKYWFTKIADDDRKYHFQKSFRSAFAADRWASKCFDKWCNGTISFRVVFDA